MGLLEDRKFGPSELVVLPHSGSGSPLYGEIAVDTLLASTNTKKTTGDSVFNNEPEMIEDESNEELYPEQEGVGSAKGTFKATLSMGDADNIALASGYSTASSVTIGGVSAKVAPLGAVKPVRLSILLRAKNVHKPNRYDGIYLPNCQVTNVAELKMSKKSIRQAEVTFSCSPSNQRAEGGGALDMEMMSDGVGTGMGLPGIYFEQE